MSKTFAQSCFQFIRSTDKIGSLCRLVVTVCSPSVYLHNSVPITPFVNGQDPNTTTSDWYYFGDGSFSVWWRHWCDINPKYPWCQFMIVSGGVLVKIPICIHLYLLRDASTLKEINWKITFFTLTSIISYTCLLFLLRCWNFVLEKIVNVVSYVVLHFIQPWSWQEESKYSGSSGVCSREIEKTIMGYMCV